MHIYDKPLNEFVAGFVGTPPMNFMRCLVRHTNRGSYLLGLEGFELHADEGLAARLAGFPNDAEVTVGIRPERMRLLFTPDETKPLAALHVAEPEGNEVIVSVRVGGKIWKIRTGKEELGGHFEADKPVNLELDQAKIHLFDILTGERIEAVQAGVS